MKKEDDFKKFAELVKDVQKIIIPKEPIVKQKIKDTFDLRLLLQILMPLLIIAGGYLIFRTTTEAHMTDETAHMTIGQKEELALTQNRSVENQKNVGLLNDIVLSNERGLLIVETKLVGIEKDLQEQDKKLDKILDKLSE